MKQPSQPRHISKFRRRGYLAEGNVGQRRMAGIFISYRRSDTEGSAGRLFERCRAHFGSGSVFFDVTDIDPGQDFFEVIDQKVSACSVLLALIGDRWITAAKRDGNLRLEDPDDVVRLEITSALQRKIPVIPVLMQAAAMPRSDQLPHALAVLSHLNAIELRHTNWDADFARLVETVERYVKPAKSPRSARRRRWLVRSLVGVALIASLVAIIVWASRVDTPGVVDLPTPAAEAILNANQFKVHVTETDRASSSLTSRVLQQQPEAGVRVFSGSTVELVTTKASELPKPQTAPSDANDARFQKDILGTWRIVRLNANKILLDEHVTFSPDGHLNAKGSLGVGQNQVLFSAFGSWAIKDSAIHYTIELSSVPGSIPVGTKGESQILDMTDDEIVSFDRTDMSTNTDFRVK